MSDLTKLKRKMVEVLRARPLKKEELKEILWKEFPHLLPDTLRKRIDRFLEDLICYGLISECGDKFCWSIRINDHTDVVLHSHQLIPALRYMAGITDGRFATSLEVEYTSAEDLKFLVSCVEDHLRSYPEVWSLLEDYRRKDCEVKRKKEKFRESLLEKLRKEFEEKSIVEPRKAKEDRFASSTIPFLIYNNLVYGSQSLTELRVEGERFGSAIISMGNTLSNDVAKFIMRETEDSSNIDAVMQIEKIQRDVGEIRKGLECEIRKLILRIESGGQFSGGCEICSGMGGTKYEEEG